MRLFAAVFAAICISTLAGAHSLQVSDRKSKPGRSDYAGFLGSLFAGWHRLNASAAVEAVPPEICCKESWRSRQWRRLTSARPWQRLRASTGWRKVREVWSRIRGSGRRPASAFGDLAQQQMVRETMEALRRMDPRIEQKAASVGMPITEDVVRRYLAASGWTSKFFGSSVPEAIASTIAWRREKNVAGITPSEIMAEAQSGKLYVNGFDRQGRPILYYRLGREATYNPEKHLKLLLYTVERAHRLAKKTNGQFVTIVDLSNFQLSKAPPLKFVRETFHSLQVHYPFCLGGLFVINAATPVQLVWKTLQHMLSEKTRAKIRFLSNGEKQRVLVGAIGYANLEKEFGGGLDYQWNPHQYFSR